MDSGGDAMGFICGGCCLIIFSGLTAFCGTQKYGSGGCGSGNRNAGCCNSCCRSSFDEDAFDAEVKKDMERTRDPNAQPKPTAQMSPELTAKSTPPPQEIPQKTSP
ncbi:hypothetical protein BDN70DRAFT_882943 [Pholiota conissans]|uniref:Uncharacterized protein n=1 Tax=Pholiota conissans TaxID=109636 RepID=A0A9P5YUU6_9AGAR|nr:hypothetical protein BDN70DRAFT_882943 [Pholiota conissans]